MASNINGAYGWLKKILIAGFLLLVVGSALVWYIFTERFTDTSERKSAYVVTAMDFIHEFEAGDSLANVKYTEKIVTVNGTISETETADSTVNLKMVKAATGSYIIFAFQKGNQDEARKIKAGDVVSIKGSCSGGAYSTILETEYITFKRCVIAK
ncbi:MAG: hypothetical protein H7258_09845 [Ferruginibacter sp.]|nr:hypothetical protein [Ferruginibacter sp.]